MVFCDGSTDPAVIEKECIYILFVEPFKFTPTLSFTALKDIPSQDADGIKSATMKAFDDKRQWYLQWDQNRAHNQISRGWH